MGQMTVVGMDEECLRSIEESKTLAGIFQSVVDDCKGLHPAIDDFIVKSTKLENQIRSTSFAFSAFLESFQKIAHKASHTKGSSRDIGACLMKISIRQKAIETQLRTFSNSLSNGLAFNLKCKNEESKKKIKSLEKNHMKEFKLLRSGIKRKIDTIHKLQKKYTKDNALEVSKQIEENTSELYTDYRVLEKQERQAVRRINLEERSQFCDFAACIRQVVVEEITVMEEVQGQREVLENINMILNDPHNMPVTADKVITDIMESGTNYSFDTPTSSIQGSLRGSRCGSLRSISSLVNSRSNSPLCFYENNQLRRERSGSGRSYINGTQNRLTRISLPDHENIKNGDDGTNCNFSFYPQFQIDSQDLGCNMSHQPPSVRRSRPNSTCEMYGRVREQSPSPARHFRDDNQTFSTIRRTHSPFRKPVVNENDQSRRSSVSTARKPPLPRKYQASERPPIPPRSESIDRVKPCVLQHYILDTHRCKETRNDTVVKMTPGILSLPDFINGQNNMVPQPVYNNDPEDIYNIEDADEEDLETPTGENLFFSAKADDMLSSSTSGSTCSHVALSSTSTDGGWGNSSILLSNSQTAPKPVVTVAPTIHKPQTETLEENLWSDKILPTQKSEKQQREGHNRRQWSSDNKGVGVTLSIDKPLLRNSESYQVTGKLFQNRPVLIRSFSETEPSPGRLSRADLTRRSLGLAERQMALRKVKPNSDRVSSSDRICRDNILQLLSDKLQARDSQQGR